MNLYGDTAKKLNQDDVVEIKKGPNGINMIMYCDHLIGSTFKEKQLKQGTFLKCKEIKSIEGHDVAIMEVIS